MRQGIHPRLRWVRWGLFSLLVVLVVGATAGRALDEVSGWVQAEYERLPWYVTRTTALLAYLALAASTVFGLLLSTKILDRVSHRPVSYTLHQDLAGIGVALALVHAATLMLDKSVPFSPAELVVPFTGPYRPLWVGLGQLTLGVSLLVLLSFYVRKRIGTRTWRSIHYLAFLAFIGATVHGLMAGSDTSAKWVYGGYLTLTAVVVFLTTYRIVLAVADRRQAVAAAGSARAQQPAAGPEAQSLAMGVSKPFAMSHSARTISINAKGAARTISSGVVPSGPTTPMMASATVGRYRSAVNRLAPDSQRGTSLARKRTE